MALSRRDFVKLCSGTVAGFGVSQMFHPAIHEAFAQTLTGERPPVLGSGAGVHGLFGHAAEQHAPEHRRRAAQNHQP